MRYILNENKRVCEVAEETSTSIRVLEPRETINGINAYQWYMNKDFHKKFSEIKYDLVISDFDSWYYMYLHFEDDSTLFEISMSKKNMALNTTGDRYGISKKWLEQEIRDVDTIIENAETFIDLRNMLSDDEKIQKSFDVSDNWLNGDDFFKKYYEKQFQKIIDTHMKLKGFSHNKQDVDRIEEFGTFKTQLTITFKKNIIELIDIGLKNKELYKYVQEHFIYELEEIK